MRIRTRLLLLILPIVLFSILMISFFMYKTWSNDIIAQFSSNNDALIVLETTARNTQGLILFGAILTVVLIMSGVAFIATNISQPIEKLKNAALTLAAGNYDKKIEVEGPKEISELANTLNTMSECLREHLTRLEESSLLREKMIGEVECIRILQHKLVQGVAENFTHPHIYLKSISIPSRAPHKVLVLEIPENNDQTLSLLFKEAPSIGVDGIYELIQGHHVDTCVRLKLERQKDTSDLWRLEQSTHQMPEPWIWSTKKGAITTGKSSPLLEVNDFVIIVNNALDQLIRQEDVVQIWFARVFRHFAEEGIEACTTLLANELAFLASKNELRAPLQAICLQIH